MSLRDRFHLDGCAAVVTGSGQGIGRGIAVGLAELGCDVVVNARRLEDCTETARLVAATGRRAVVVVGDVRTEATMEGLAAACLEAFDRLDVWVNNVGGSDDKTLRPLVDTPDDVWRSMLELNVTTAFRGAKAAAARMVQGGCIVNISSGAGMRGSPLTGPYAAAKAAMLNLTQTLALELAERGIRVNAVSPGQVPTEAFRTTLADDEDRLAELAAATPLGRLGTPEDVAAAVAYLASPAGSWVTGENLLVAGGRTQRGGGSRRYG
jgi:NAD(P)-dependent dehydrogenase (short-subunit alcohol dehydrogenase family)